MVKIYVQKVKWLFIRLPRSDWEHSLIVTVRHLLMTALSHHLLGQKLSQVHLIHASKQWFRVQEIDKTCQTPRASRIFAWKHMCLDIVTLFILQNIPQQLLPPHLPKEILSILTAVLLQIQTSKIRTSYGWTSKLVIVQNCYRLQAKRDHQESTTLTSWWPLQMHQQSQMESHLQVSPR